MNRVLLLAWTCTCIAPGIGDAQDNGLACESILSGNIHDIHYSIGYDYHAQKFQSWACNSNFVTARSMRESAASLGIKLKGIPFGIDFSDDQNKFQSSLSEWCLGNDDAMYSDSFRRDYSQEVSSALISAFGTCLEHQEQALTHRSGVYAYAKPENPRLATFLVTLIVQPQRFDSDLELISIEGSVECRINNSPVDTPHKLTTRETVFTCYNHGSEGAIVAFNTSVGTSDLVKLPSRGDNRLLELENRLSILEEAILSRTYQLNVGNEGPHYFDTEISVEGYPAAAIGGWRLYGKDARCKSHDKAEIYLSQDRRKWRILVDKSARCDVLLVALVFLPEPYIQVSDEVMYLDPIRPPSVDGS